MDETLRPPRLGPSNLGEILDRTAELYRSRFLMFLGISVVPTALVLVPCGGIFLLLAWLGSLHPDAAPSPQAQLLAAAFLIAAGVMVLPILLGVTALTTAAMNHAVSRAYLGEKTTIRGAYKAVWGRGWKYTWLLILEGLVIGAVPMAVWTALLLLTVGAATLARHAGLGSVGSGAFFGLLAVLAVVALIGYVFWMLLRLSLAFPACVIEEIGAWTALKRSSSLSEGTKGRIFLLYLLGAALNWLLSMGITLPMMIILALFPGSNSPQHAQTVGMAFAFVVYGAAFAVQVLTKPIYGIALTLFYYDQRIRHEGYDIEWMMQRAGLKAPPLPEPEATQPAEFQRSPEPPPAQ